MSDHKNEQGQAPEISDISVSKGWLGAIERIGNKLPRSFF